MNLTIHLGSLPLRLWHVRLAARLAERPGTTLAIARAATANEAGGARDLLFRFETVLHGLTRPGLFSKAGPDALFAYSPPSAGNAGLIVDLTGSLIPATNVWRLTIDGEPGETGIVAAALAGRAPVATIMASGEPVATGRLGTERPGIALAALEDHLARLITLIEAALDGAACRRLPETDAVMGTSALPGTAQLAKRAAKDGARALARRVYGRLYRTPHWRTGWRRIVGDDTIGLGHHPDGGWTDLPDDGQRFYADPFPFEHDGIVTLFVEDFDHRIQKGIISAVAFGPGGPLGVPEPVLECPTHLSYPFVFEQEGDIWMIPETCAARSIDLYRAKNYPGGWVHEARLVEGVIASDATLLRHQGQWWMFATVQDEGGAFSDTLHLWSAPHFRGPWTPHPRNPVLIDIASARPAGRIVARNGTLIRPVQDCRQGYGNALGLARITKLDHEGFEQNVETILRAGPLWPGRRLHTLNAAGGFEFIDGSGEARRSMREIIGLA